ncbi:hypothetical protein [Streptomyces sp. NPDC085540]|uniref:hypothetical protein n=1 Tax=Streptomyces sp. NPDC085540 TaxID=3365730 RepID=UPI0037D441BD
MQQALVEFAADATSALGGEDGEFFDDEGASAVLAGGFLRRCGVQETDGRASPGTMLGIQVSGRWP